MAVPTYPSAITLTDIQTEFGGSNPASLNEYYSGGTYVASGIANSTGTVIPTSGAINFLNFSGAVSFPVDPTQPTVTLDHFHGKWSWGNEQMYDLFQSNKTGHIYARAGNNLLWCLDGSGAKVFANTYTTGQGAWAVSERNPYYIYWKSGSGSSLVFGKTSNTGTIVKQSNISWGTSNTSIWIYGLKPTSGTANANTSLYGIFASNVNSGNCTTSIVKINASDMTTVEWAKTTSVIGSDVTANIRPNYIYTTADESAVIVSGQRTTTNTVVLVLAASDGATQQSWQTAPNYEIKRKPTSANNIALSYVQYFSLKSNTGANVANLYISNTSWTGAYASYIYDIDYDSNIYCAARRQVGNTSEIVATIAKYNTSGTRQWQIKIGTTNSANGVLINSFSASNNRLVLQLQEFTETWDGFKWYTSGFGVVRYLSIDAASGNTGTMGEYTLTSDTTSIWSTGTGNIGLWSYTYSPRTTYDFTLAANTLGTGTANTGTFTKTAL
jgi:hypothetical protein